MANCIYCKEEFVGRSDKKYCSDQCRSAHHNELNQNSLKYIREVNSILRKNRKVLEELNPTGKNKVHRDMLLKKGFQFEYLTSTYTTKAGKVYYFCYEHGYLPLNENFYALVIKNLE